jgi:hypothetical protein
VVSSRAQLLNKDYFVFLLLAYLNMGFERAQAGTCTVQKFRQSWTGSREFISRRCIFMVRDIMEQEAICVCIIVFISNTPKAIRF